MKAKPSALLVVLLLACSLARAEPKLTGAVDTRALLGVDKRYGASIGLDLWAGSGLFRVGGTFAVGALSKGDEASSRVFTPFGLSLGLMPRGDQGGPTAVLRGGVYAGAQKGGLIAGPFVSCALGYRANLGEGASVRFGVDLWGLFKHESGLFLGPYVGLGF